MRLWIVFIKTWREMGRDWWMLGLTLAFSPLFVLIYWSFTQGGSTSYTILVINQDRGNVQANGERWFASPGAIEAIRAVSYADGKPLLRVREIESQEQVGDLLRDREAAAYLLIPEDFSETIASLKSGDRGVSTTIHFGGDLTNPYYTVGAILALGALDSFVFTASDQKPIILYTEEALGASAARTEFENYTPGILVFAVIMLVFLAAMTVAREIETGTLRRLQITPLSSFEYLGGVTLALVLLGVISVVITFGTALALGFHSQGPLWVAVLVGAVTSFAIIGVGLIVACFSRSVSQAFVIANFPLGFFMFFTGAIFPIGNITLIYIGGREIGLFDLLPPTHAVVALNKILTLGVSPADVLYELATLSLLSLLFFGIGVWLFQRLHLEGSR